MGLDGVKDVALKHAVHNAVSHNGQAQIGPVIGRVLGESPGLKSKAREVMAIVRDVVEEVNSWSMKRQIETLGAEWPELLEERTKDKKKTLPPLENVERFPEVRTRFAPNPDGPLHLGSAEPIIFCDEYAKMYDGKFILRFEDTSPDVKAPIPAMYDWIKEDIEWLGVRVDEVYKQSDRLEIYYDYAERLLNIGAAYVCTCKPPAFRKFYMASKACPCRDQQPEIHLERWRKMLDGTFSKGDAVVRIKTDLNHPNPAIRDWPALRIASGSHPLQGTKYNIWPLYNFSCAIDDHELSISHIIRGKEHEVNTHRQKYIYKYLGWEYPEIINVGRLGLEVGVLSKSKIRAGLEAGLYRSWDDPRLGTLRALKRRGLQPKTIRELMIQVGPKPINSTISWGHIASINRKNIDPIADRYFFVKDPIDITVLGVGVHKVKLPLHPDNPSRGYREYVIDPEVDEVSLVISKADSDQLSAGKIIRLMGLYNVEIIEVGSRGVLSRYYSETHQEARDLDASFIHWLPNNMGIGAKVVMPDASVAEGVAEAECGNLKVDDMIQFERFGFVRVDNISPFTAYYAHR